MISNISIVIITKNAGETLQKTLDSLHEFEEVVIYDNGSIDNTHEIAKQFSNVRWFEGEFMGFGPTKNYAVSLASNDWVLSLDADESLPNPLVQEIYKLSLDNSWVLYEVKRTNFLKGKAVYVAGWGNDWLIRLFNRSRHTFSEVEVHESIFEVSQSQKKRLINSFEHDAVRSVLDFVLKIHRYSGMRRQCDTKVYPVPIIFMKAFFAFFRSYILKAGVIAGWRGLIIAVSDANGVFYRYLNAYANKQAKEN